MKSPPSQTCGASRSHPTWSRSLHERTQGWAAGLVLMLEHAKVSGRIAELPGDATPKVIFDYLAGEIFDRFEPKTQQFLLRVACLPRVSAEVAEALTGEPRAGRLLLNLSQNDYFVREVPGEEGRYLPAASPDAGFSAQPRRADAARRDGRRGTETRRRARAHRRARGGCGFVARGKPRLGRGRADCCGRSGRHARPGPQRDLERLARTAACRGSRIRSAPAPRPRCQPMCTRVRERPAACSRRPTKDFSALAIHTA